MRVCLPGLVFICLSVLGCSPAGPGYQHVRLEGIITIDGKPLDSGGIQFLPISNRAPAVGGVIGEAGYAVDGVPVGKAKVLLTAIRKTHRLPDSGDGLEKWATENLIPERYRQGIEIEIATDESRRDFELTSD